MNSSFIYNAKAGAQGERGKMKIDPNEACPICNLMGDHLENCPNEPEEWKHCQHEVYDPRILTVRPDGKGFNYDGCCLKCGKPIY